MARFLVHGDEYQPRDHQARLPIKWLAPEAAHYNRFSTKSDVWAFGVVMWEILSLGQRPFQAMSEQEVLTMLTAGKRSGGACI